MTEFLCEPLGKQHDRSRFNCGVPELDIWIKERARQDQKRRVAAVYAMVPRHEPTRIAGFYSLSSTSLGLATLPDHFAKKLPRYGIVPAILIGRLARDGEFPGIGELLLLDALQRAWRHSAEIAAAAVVVDAKNDKARDFYQRYEFEPLLELPDRLILPMTTVEQMFRT